MGRMGGSWRMLRAGKVARAAAASMALALTLASVGGAWAHEVQPAVMDVTVAPETAIEVVLNAEAILAGVDLSQAEDTDAAAQAEAYDALRALPPEALAERFEAAFPDFARGLTLEGLGAPELVSVAVTPEPDEALPRDTRVAMRAALRAEAPRIGWAERYGYVIVRQQEAGEDAFAALLPGGAVSPPLPPEGRSAEGAGATFARYVVSGFEHIVPLGADHILFVLGLFFFSLHLGPLLWQVTAFTVAHTATLALATLGVVSVSPAVVEPLIALSIAYVGVENVLRPRLGWWRPAVVFGFGLLHGLGFASVLSDVGGGTGNLLARLIGFNVGVELGQLAVIAAAFVLLALPFGRRPWWRPYIAVPASLAIAAVGAWWAVERTLLA